MWLPLDDHKLQNVGGDRERAKVLRVFGWDGQLWPRLVIAIYQVPPGDLDEIGYLLDVSEKKNLKAWWTHVPVPESLLPVLREMLSEVADR